MKFLFKNRFSYTDCFIVGYWAYIIKDNPFLWILFIVVATMFASYLQYKLQTNEE